jgi:hypothetical protein
VIIGFSYGENTVDMITLHCWVIKSRDSGGNLNLYDQALPGRLVTATQNLNRQEVDEPNKVNQ